MHPSIAFKSNLQKSNTNHYADTKLFSNTLKQASFEVIDHKKVSTKKLYESNDDNDKSNAMSDRLFNQSSERLTSILDSNKTVGLDELMNLLKN